MSNEQEVFKKCLLSSVVVRIASEVLKSVKSEQCVPFNTA